MSFADEVRIGAFVFTSRHEGQSAGEVLARGVATAQAAEAAGFDDVWVTEHHFVPFGVNPSALTFAGYLLGRTSTVRVGTAVTVLPLHSPVHVAEQTALLDHLSGGRFDLGVGRAQPVVDYEAIGRGVEYWQRGLPEALDLTLAALAGPVSADSDLYRFREVVPEPGPAQGRSTPVYLAANSPASVELAATRGLPMLLFFDKDIDAKAAMIAEHAEIARAAGHPDTGYAHGTALFAHVADGPEEARQVMRRAATEFVRASSHYQLLLDVPQRISRDVAPEQIIDGMTDSVMATHPVGTPQICVERLVDQIRGSGCRRVLCQVEAAGDHDSVLANVKRMGEEVLPEVRRRLRAG
ncbi:LLM class flavin-dependent oxidoreductase [Nocardia transvalensis]|uniref:LLM class flavin-dependent oxidoreductase n=1 Tax=Nocardia transvalensis TaxID=37333 RepID=UPI00189417D4|nr:LLM class flavin-dependent oxidoreductase [Nocardia transvalensis]MBF6329882.1 LLM class flavin-dependent oxidoreductase [Nocardia transvalensis]